MKSLFSFIFLFLFANSAFAANLCDTSCNLTITFPSGGSIEATEALTFTFGTGGALVLGTTGTVNTAVQPSNTDFSSGGELALAIGESITFDEGGLLDFGAGGAIDFTSIAVTTDGVFDLQVESVAESVYIGGITINGMGSLIINVTGTTLELGDITLDEGDITISADVINITGSIISSDSIPNTITLIATNLISLDGYIPTTCTTLSSSIVLISGGSDLLIDDDSSLCTNILTINTNTTDLTGLTVTPAIQLVGTIISTTDASGIITVTSTPSTIDLDATDLTLNSDPVVIDFTPATRFVVDGVRYQIENITVDDELVQIAIAPDGTTGTIEFIDGELVFVPDEEQSGSGASSWLLLFGLPLFMSVLRRRQLN